MNDVRHSIIAVLAAGCALATPVPAAAQQALTAKPVNLRAGPARDYPLVASYGPGAPIAVQGCTAGYGWCDVIGPDGARGWLYAANIVYPYQNAQVPVLGYGAVIGLPIVTFAIGSYWGSYYRNRPWYGNRSHWAQRPPPVYRPRPPAFRPPPPHFTPPRPVMRPPNEGGRPPGIRPPESGRPPMSGRPPGGPPRQMGGGPGRPSGGGDRGGDRGGSRGGDHGGGRGNPGGHGPGHER